MPDILHLSAGETRQLRAPSEGVARWTSSAPAVVTTTDEDLVAGNPGGLLTAIKPGRAKITAFGYDNKTTVCQWDVEVEAAGATTIQLEKNEVADLPGTLGMVEWTIENLKVAEMAGEGRVRGLSPGVTTARGRGGGPADECTIEVSGTLDVELNQSVSLASFFSCQVRSWRTSSPNEVPIDSAGTVATGARARTVEVFAELAPDRIFQFRLRIGAGSRSAPLPRTAALRSGASSSGAAISSTTAVVTPEPVTSPPPSPPDQRRMVENHLRAAETHLLGDNWTQAGAELTAARLTAVTDPDLSRRVEQMNERYRATVSARAAVMVGEAIRLLLADEYESVYRQLDSARVPRDFSSVIEAVRRFATLCQQTRSDGDYQTQDNLEQELAVVWGEVTRMNSYSALPPLAEIGLQHGDRIVSLLVDTLSNPGLSGMPIAVRQSLGQALANAGALSLETAVSRMVDTTTPPAEANLLLSLLPDLNLQRHAAVLVKRFATATQTERARLVALLSALHKNSATALLDLLSAVAIRLPPDMRLALAIQKQIGAEELERIASRWAAGGHRGAKTLLERLYDYSPGSF